MHATETPTGGEFDFSTLSVIERIDLAHKLWESVREQMEKAPLTDTELAEVRWRLDAIDAGIMVCEPFDSVMAYAARR